MASFLRDRDLDRFDASEDVTAESPPPPPQNNNITRAASASVSPRKKTKIADATNSRENESLMKRMGGPSAAKAGLGKDQEEVGKCCRLSTGEAVAHLISPHLLSLAWYIDQSHHLRSFQRQQVL